MKNLSVAIVGLGTAGPAAALFLARVGHRVTLFERVPSPGPVGAGIMLQPTGAHVLSLLGLREEVLSRGAPVDQLSCRTKSGFRILELAYSDFQRGLVGTGLHRGALFQSLYAAVKAQPGIDLRLGVEVEDVVEGAHVLVDSKGERYGPFDLVVVADGARSKLRGEGIPDKTVVPYPWGALWWVGESPDSLPRRTLLQIMDGSRKMLGFLPTGVGPQGDKPLHSLFWSIRADRVAAFRESGLDAWKAEVRALTPLAEGLLSQIHSTDELLFAPYFDVFMSHYHAQRVVYLGDAAHAMSPQLGQGCNLALVDAWVLSEAVAEASSVEGALAEYSRRRRAHLAFYTRATRWLTPFFQSDGSVLAFLRDVGMSTASRLWPVRREMVRSMVGVKTGFLFGTFDAPLSLPAKGSD